jgi:hypothetical protein
MNTACGDGHGSLGFAYGFSEELIEFHGGCSIFPYLFAMFTGGTIQLSNHLFGGLV